MSGGAPLRVGIVGGGVSGLTAAWEAARRGHRPEVFEAAPDLGGLAGGLDFHGASIDRYYHFICGGDRDLLELCDELEIGHLVRWRSTRTLQYAGGRFHRLDGALDLLRFRAVPPLARLRFAALALYGRLLRDGRSLERREAGAWLRGVLGEAGYEAVWGPLLRRKFGAGGDAIAARWIWHRIHRVGTSRRRPWSPEVHGYIEGGSRPLFDALLDRLRRAGVPVRTGARVDAIALEGGRAAGLVVAGETARFDRVVAALPLPAFAALLPEAAGALRAAAAAVEFTAVACVLLLLSRPLTDAFWVNVNDPGSELSGFIEYTNLDPLPALGGRALVYVPYYCRPDDARWRLRDAELVERAVAELARVVPGFARGAVEDARVFRDRWAQPVCLPGFAASVLPVATPVPGLYLLESTQLYPADRSRSGMIGLARANAELLFGPAAAAQRATSSSPAQAVAR